MRVILLKSKIHRCTVTEARPDYEGSLSIDPQIMKLAHILPYEQLHIYDVTNGNRIITYAIEGGPGEFGVNGAAAHQIRKGDLIIVATYSPMEMEEAKKFAPTVVLVGPGNKVKDVHHGILGGPFTLSPPKKKSAKRK